MKWQTILLLLAITTCPLAADSTHHVAGRADEKLCRDDVHTGDTGRHKRREQEGRRVLWQLRVARRRARPTSDAKYSVAYEQSATDRVSAAERTSRGPGAKGA